MKLHATVSALAALVAAAGFSAPGDAPQDVREAIHGIQVIGTGEVSAKPDTVLIRGEFSANADTAADALVKYRDGRRRALKMMEELGIEGLAVTGAGPTISISPVMNDRNAMRAAMMGMDSNQQEADGKVQVRETLTIRVGKLADPDASADVVAKVLDKAKEAGIRIVGADVIPPYSRAFFGMSGEDQKDAVAPVAYVVTDRAKLEEAACVQAMADARRRAEMLAKLAGRQVGKVIHIKDDGPAAEKTSFDGTYRVTLHVIFEIQG
jgi:uncharacterized protein YggE